MLDPQELAILRVGRILTGALMLAPAAYVALFLAAARPASDGAIPIAALLAPAALALVAAPLLRRMLTSNAPRSPRTWLAGLVLAQALRESAAVFGLVASFSSGETWPVAACAIAATAAMVLAYPTEDSLERHLRG